LKAIESKGGRVSFREGQNGFAPDATPGRAGQVILDPDASVGALRHEYQHFLDDEAAGRPGLSYYLGNLKARWRLERRAYMLELAIAKRLGDRRVRKQLIENALEEKRAIYGH
jgi:hypothetical protein